MWEHPDILAQLTSSPKNAIAIIGAPLDLGAGRRGVDMGPSAVRVAGLGRRLAALGYDVSDLGNIPVDAAGSGGRRGPERGQISASNRGFL